MDQQISAILDGGLQSGRIQPRWWTSITAPFGLLSKRQHPQRSVSLEGLHMLKKLNLSYCNLEQVPESIGGLSCLEELDLEGNNFTSLPGSLSQLSHLQYLRLDGCKKLEVLPELPHSLEYLDASDCTSLREVGESSTDPFRINDFRNWPKLFKNVTIASLVLARLATIYSIGLLYHRFLLEALVKAISANPDPPVRLAAINAAFQFSTALDPDLRLHYVLLVLPALTTAKSDDPDLCVRLAATVATAPLERELQLQLLELLELAICGPDPILTVLFVLSHINNELDLSGNEL